MGPRTTHLTSQKFDFWIDGGVFVSLQSREIRPWFIHTKTSNIIHHILEGSIIMELLVMVEVVLVLGPPTDPPKKIILVETGIMGGFTLIIMSVHHPNEII